MTYQPSIRCPKGMQTMARPAMSAVCDVCSKPRVRKGGHDKCSKIRQAAGFIIKHERKAAPSDTTLFTSDRPHAQPANGYRHRRNI